MLCLHLPFPHQLRVDEHGYSPQLTSQSELLGCQAGQDRGFLFCYRMMVAQGTGVLWSLNHHLQSPASM